jgi:hypothetical protein
MDQVVDNTQPPKPKPAVAAGDDLASAIRVLAEALSSGQANQNAVLSQLQANQPRREMDYGEYILQHPVRKLPRPVFQNAYPVNPNGLSAETEQKMLEIVPGRYINNYVTVTENGEGETRATFFIYRNRNIKERFEQQEHFKSFTDMIDKCHAEMRARQAQPDPAR